VPLGAFIGGILEGAAEGEERRRDQEYQKFRMQMQREELALQQSIFERERNEAIETARRLREEEERRQREARREAFMQPFTGLSAGVSDRAAPDIAEVGSLFEQSELARRAGTVPTQPMPTGVEGPPEAIDFDARRRRVAEKISGLPAQIETSEEARREREKIADFERAKQLKYLEARLSKEKTAEKRKPIGGPLLAEVNSHTNVRSTIKDLKKLVATKETTGPVTQAFASKYARMLGLQDKDVLRTDQALKLVALGLVLEYARTTFTEPLRQHIETIGARISDNPEAAIQMLDGLSEANEMKFKQKLFNARAAKYDVDDLIQLNFGSEGLAEAMGTLLQNAPPEETPTVTFRNTVTQETITLPLSRVDLIKKARRGGLVQVD